MVIGALDVWGKKDPSTHLLEYHLLDTANVSIEFLGNNPHTLGLLERFSGLNPEKVIKLVSFLCAIHDIGKVSNRFQSPRDGFITYRHDVGGYLLLVNHLLPRIARLFSDHPSDRRLKANLRTVLRTSAMHHGSPRGCTDQNHIDGYPLMFDENDLARAVTILDHMMELLDVGEGEFQGLLTSKGFNQTTNLVAGIISLSDWVASGEFEHVPIPRPLSEYMQESREFARRLFAEDRLDMLLGQLQTPEFEDIFDFPPSPVQRRLSEIDSDGAELVIVEDATGAGKTEAALIHALRQLSRSNREGITFALPTRSTSNLMFMRLEYYAKDRIKQDMSVTLQHGSSRTFLQSEGLSTDSRWVFGKNKALFANISVCTVDQVLGAVIPTRFQPLKLLSISRHVVIVDEVHAYDAYMFGLLCNLVRHCRRYAIPLILLSATLPSGMKRALLEAYGSRPVELKPNYPLVTVCTEQSVEQLPCECSERSIRDIALRYTSDESLVLEEMTGLAERGMRVCWIRNTVEDAIETFNRIPGGTYEKILIHSRFTLQDRTKLEQRLFKLCGKSSGCSGLVVVSTQIIEQSMDIEFERIYSDLAPVDSLIQRMGRDQRFGDSPLPCEFVVHGPSLEGNVAEDWFAKFLPRAAYVYPDHSVLHNTAILMSRDRISIPSDYRDFIEFAYSEPSPDSPFRRTHEEHLKNCSISDSNSRRVMLDPDTGYGCSLSEEFTDNQWDAIERATTRENDDRTAQCILMVDSPDGPTPISGRPETSLITLRKRLVPSPEDGGPWDYGRWRFVGRMIMKEQIDEEGKVFWTAPGLRYTRDRGAEYVQFD